MLRNDPPLGSKVRFLATIRKDRSTVRCFEVGTLEKRGGYAVDRPHDRFCVRYRGVVFEVERQDIELV